MNNFNGIILVDKPVGCTSHDVVAKARRALNTKSVGHAGTLDPIASGLLVLLVGEATKISNYILQGDKGYSVKVKLGVVTDSLDVTGEVLESHEVNIKKDQIENVIHSVSGEVELSVPVFSAVKVNGRKLYQDAHQNKEPKHIPHRTMKFYDIKIINIQNDSFEVELKCSKGSYIRAWAHEVGRRLQVGGCVATLRRLWSEPFGIEKATSLEALISNTEDGFIPLSQTLTDWPLINVSGVDQRLMSHGQISHGLAARLRPYAIHFKGSKKGIKVASGDSNNLMALLMANELGQFSIARVFNS